MPSTLTSTPSPPPASPLGPASQDRLSPLSLPRQRQPASPSRRRAPPRARPLPRQGQELEEPEMQHGPTPTNATRAPRPGRDSSSSTPPWPPPSDALCGEHAVRELSPADEHRALGRRAAGEQRERRRPRSERAPGARGARGPDRGDVEVELLLGRSRRRRPLARAPKAEERPGPERGREGGRA